MEVYLILDQHMIIVDHCVCLAMTNVGLQVVMNE